MPVMNGLFNVIVAWDKGPTEEATGKIKGFFLKALTQKKSNGFATDSEHVTFLDNREDVDRYIEDGRCDALIVSESLAGDAIGTGAIKAWKKMRQDMKIVLVMNNNKKGSGKAQGLYKMSYYRGLFIDDFTPTNVFELLCANREPMDAFEYYGVGYYRSKDEQVVKPDIHAEEASSEKKTPADAAEHKDTDMDGKASKKVSGKAGKTEKEGKESSKKEHGKAKGEKSSKDKDTKAKADKKKGKSEKSEKKASREDDTKASAAEEIMNGVVEGNAYAPSSFDELLAESESYFDDGYADGGQYLEVDDADEGLSGYADIPESGDGNVNEDDSLALGLLIPADMFEEDMDIESALSGDDADALAYIKAREEEAFMPTEIYYEPNLVDEICERVLTYYTLENPTNMTNLEQGIMSREEFDYELNRFLQKIDVEPEVMEQVKEKFYEFMWGYDIITPFINDPTISDIKLEAPNRIRIKRQGKRYFSKIVFRSDNHYKSFISHIARKNFVNLKDGKPDKTFMDTTTSDVCRLRFVLSTEYINSNNFPTLVIRKIPNQKYTVEQLVNAGMMSAKTAAFLVDEVRRGKSFLVTGSMASGKTTWMNTMLDFISHGKSMLVIQESEELFSKVHPDAIFQRIQTSDDGELAYDLRYLSTYGLLMDVNYFMVGELKGAESKQFVDAVYTNTICWASLHCPSSRDALPRVADMAKFSSDYSEGALLERLASGIDYVIFLEEFKVKELSRVKGFDRKTKEVIYEEVELW